MRSANSFDIYPLDSNKIEKTYTHDLAYAGETIDEEQRPPYSCMMGVIHLIPVDETLKANIMLKCTSNNTPWDYQNLKSFRHLIYKVDVPGESIELMYKYYPDFTGSLIVIYLMINSTQWMTVTSSFGI